MQAEASYVLQKGFSYSKDALEYFFPIAFMWMEQLSRAPNTKRKLLTIKKNETENKVAKSHHSTIKAEKEAKHFF